MNDIDMFNECQIVGGHREDKSNDSARIMEKNNRPRVSDFISFLKLIMVAS